MSATGTKPSKKSTATPKATKPAKAVKKPTLTAVPGIAPAGEKFCKRHNTTHPFEAFAKDRSSKSGYYSICKQAEADDRAAKKLMAATPAPVAVPAAKAGKSTNKAAAKK